ncbi:MAG: amidophosphoribosyltransferase [Patescibacteria group bacterium]
MPQESCGVFGIHAPGENVARLTYFGILALQHRGQESAGIATSCGKQIRLERQAGRVDRFTENQLWRLTGDRDHSAFVAIGHTRYSNTGGNTKQNFQPIKVNSKFGEFALAHNGNLLDPLSLKSKLSSLGITPRGTSDSELIALLVSYYSRKSATFQEAIKKALSEIVGAYSLVIVVGRNLIGIRDPWGIRPLSVGILNGGGQFILASETCALDALGAQWDFDLQPGEIVTFSNGKYQVSQLLPKISKRLCIFEFIYFASPGSILYDRLLQTARRHMGEELFREHPVEIGNPHDWVVGGVPDTGTPAAKGYAEASGLEVRDVFIKNRYVGRTFIQPDQHLRTIGVRAKLQVLPREVLKKKVVVLEDSIVRGTTTKQTVRLIREAGALEVHVRITSPPYRHRCLMGIDTQYSSELIASHKSIEEIAQEIGADSLGYLSLPGVISAINKEKYLEAIPDEHFCPACFTGEYPFEIPQEQGRCVLETIG